MRLLLVEDEARLAEQVRAGLVAEGFTVDVARTGPDGLWAATETRFDAVVLDVQLPGMSGVEVLRRLRAAEVWSPVLMLTAHDGEQDQADALDLGADDYLTKPFSFLVLLARLRALLRRGAPERPAVLVAGALALDPASRTVRRGDTEITLTPREFAVLELLLRRQGQVVSKTELLQGAWDAHFDGDLNVVEVYIGYLRRKVDDPFATPCIQTVRGSGYRLVPADAVSRARAEG